MRKWFTLARCQFFVRIDAYYGFTEIGFQGFLLKKCVNWIDQSPSKGNYKLCAIYQWNWVLKWGNSSHWLVVSSLSELTHITDFPKSVFRRFKFKKICVNWIDQSPSKCNYKLRAIYQWNWVHVKFNSSLAHSLIVLCSGCCYCS